MVVLNKIYTRTGDDGSTGLGDGTRVQKEHLRVEAYGTVDEANSAIGVLLAIPGLPGAVAEFSWKDLGHREASRKPLQFWMRRL